MKAKNYLNIPAFKVWCPHQTWGGRNDQILVINSVPVNYGTIKNNFISGVIDRLMGDITLLENFIYWNQLFDALNNFMNDVELNYPLAEVVRSGYEPDNDSDDDLEMGRNFPKVRT